MSFEKDDVNVPAPNSTVNSTIVSVIGNKTDDETNIIAGSGVSLMGRAYAQEKHVHSGAKVYPTVGAGGAGWVPGALFSTNAIAGTFGVYADLMPAGTALAPFDIHWINIESLGANAGYEMVIAEGAPAAEVEIGRVRFTRIAVQEAANGVPFTMPIKTAATRIRAKVTSSNVGAVDIRVSVFYHEY